jgi:hypothetical protein
MVRHREPVGLVARFLKDLLAPRRETMKLDVRSIVYEPVLLSIEPLRDPDE